MRRGECAWRPAVRQGWGSLRNHISPAAWLAAGRCGPDPAQPADFQSPGPGRGEGKRRGMPPQGLLVRILILYGDSWLKNHDRRIIVRVIVGLAPSSMAAPWYLLVYRRLRRGCYIDAGRAGANIDWRFCTVCGDL